MDRTPALMPDEQLWSDRNQHLLRARLKGAVAAGRVAIVGPMHISRWGEASVRVRLIDAPRQRSIRLGVFLAVFAAIVAAVVLVWLSRHILMIGGLLFLAGMIGVQRRSGRSVMEVIQIVRIKR